MKKQGFHTLKTSVIAAILIIMIVATVGCTGTADAKPSEVVEEPAATVEPEEEPEMDPVEFDGDITVFVPVKAGGALDLRARAIAPYLSEELGVNVIVENVPGGGGVTATTELLTNPKSDYDMILSGVSIFTSSVAFNDVIYSVDDFKPLAAIDVEKFCLFVASDSNFGFTTFDDVMNYASENELIFGSGGVGNVTMLFQAYMYSKLGYQSNTLAHNGAVEGITNCMGGHNAITWSGTEVARSYVESGDLIPVLVMSKDNYSGYEGIEVPSVTTVEGLDESNCYESMMAISCLGTVDEEHETALRQAVQNCLQNPDCVADLKAGGLQYTPDMAPDEIVTYIKNEYNTIVGIIETLDQ